MKTDTFKITIHMVSSLDGFIAKKDNDISWMRSTDKYEKGVTITKEYIADFLKSIDCYVMGSRTYEHALELGWVYGDTPVVVLTHRDLTTDRKNVEFYSGNLNKLVNGRLKPNYRTVWLVGGAMVVKDFMRLKLADEIRLSILPIILGGGTLFFDHIGQEQRLHLKDVTAYKDGMVELWYKIEKN
ncbi:MAG TPA: dihydrofolate reductase family protein [Mariniflexile sp.]|jgi:dihydrofolate reductase